MISTIFIKEALKNFRMGNGPHVLTVRRLRGWAGLSYRNIYFFEKIRVIPRAYRDEDDRRQLLWDRTQAIDMLSRILNFLELKEGLRREGKCCNWIAVVEVLISEGKLCLPQGEGI